MTCPDETLSARAEQHLPLVKAMMKRIPHRAEDREEVYQQGCLGLMKALRTFDPGRGAAFSTYAAPFILGEMRQVYRQRQAVRVPRGEMDLRRRIRRAQDDLTALLHREPTITELAEALHMEPTELTLHMEGTEAASTGSEGALADLLPDPEDIEKRIELRDILSRLPEGDQRIVTLRHRLGLTQAETGRRLGMSQMQVSRREAIIRTLLRRALADG